MIKQKIKAWWPSIALAILILLIPKMFGFVVSISSHDIEDVRNKMKSYLYKKYGEEFVVDRIGTRSSRGQEFYQARIYPKSILGTPKEGDSYYYASATADKLPLGRLGGVGDSYSYVSRNIDMENYLLPQAKNEFGERVLLKVDVEHKVTGDGSWWAGYKSKSLKQMRNKVKNDPEHNRIELELDVYVFDRIESKKEKEERRKNIFQFVQYLKEEKLFSYSRIGVYFIDERVLADSYYKLKKELYHTKLVEKNVRGETVKLPPIEFREKISKQLQNEVKKLREEELVNNMNRIKKGRLTYEYLREYNGQYYCLIYSPRMKKLRTNVQKNDFLKKYNNIKDVLLKEYNKYIFLN